MDDFNPIDFFKNIKIAKKNHETNQNIKSLPSDKFTHCIEYILLQYWSNSNDSTEYGARICWI